MGQFLLASAAQALQGWHLDPESSRAGAKPLGVQLPQQKPTVMSADRLEQAAHGIWISARNAAARPAAL